MRGTTLVTAAPSLILWDNPHLAVVNGLILITQIAPRILNHILSTLTLILSTKHSFIHSNVFKRVTNNGNENCEGKDNILKVS